MIDFLRSVIVMASLAWTGVTVVMCFGGAAMMYLGWREERLKEELAREEARRDAERVNRITRELRGRIRRGKPAVRPSEASPVSDVVRQHYPDDLPRQLAEEWRIHQELKGQEEE